MFTANLCANRSTLLLDGQMKAFPNVMRHYNYMTSTTFFTSVMGRSFAPMKAGLPLADSEKTKEFAVTHGAKVIEAKAPVKKQAAPKKKEVAKPKKVEEEDPEAEPKEVKKVLTEEEKVAGNEFYDYKTLYANAKDKNEAVDELFKKWDTSFDKYFSVWSCHYDKLDVECKEEIKTNNMMSFFFRGMDGTNKDMLAVHGMYGPSTDHDIKGIWMWRGVEYNDKMKDHNSAEYYNFTRMDMSKQESRDKLRAYWTNTTNGEGSVEGLTPLNVKIWK